MTKFFSKLITILLCLSTYILLISFSIKAMLLFKPLYYFDIKNLNIESMSGLTENEIRKNYDYMVDYLTSSSNLDFKLPTLPSSKKSHIHFYEVKKIFVKLNYALIISALIISASILFNKYIHKYINISFIKWSSILLLSTSGTLIVLFLMGFHKTFTLFHHITFDNNYWLFNPSEDPVINILPEEFFFHCAIFITFLITLSGILLMGVYKILKKKHITDVFL